jgi:pimeloyl-ACP methyl ester carboxylesterase
MMPLDLAPHIVQTEDGREVGYRRFGNGPPAVLLHASPRSALAVLPLGEALSDRFTVFAFDTPGFGWSEPLRIARPDAADFGDALIAAFDALGLGQAPVYGTHTGAAIAVAAANHHPQRISALVLDGYGVFTPAEQSEYAQFYLAPIRPEWAGTHLAWLWSRVKDQFTVFPWHLMGQWARLPRALADAATMQAVVTDFLTAGDAYRSAYAAAFRIDGRSAVRTLTVPTTLMARSDDLLFSHLDLLGELPPNVKVQTLDEDRTEWTAAIIAAMQSAAASDPPLLPKPILRFRAAASAQHILRVTGGTIGISSSGRSSGPKLVLLPGIPGSARGEAHLTRSLGRDFAVFGVDPPGFGASSLPGQPDLAAIAAALLAALGELAIDDFRIAAIGESAALGCALASLAPRSRVTLLAPVPDAARLELARQISDLTPRRDGSHLLAAWHQLRDSRLWRPWYDAQPRQAVNCGTDPDVESLQTVLTDWMRGGVQGAATLTAVLAPPLTNLMTPIKGRTSLILLPEHPWSKEWSRFAGQNNFPFLYASDDPGERAQTIRKALAL